MFVNFFFNVAAMYLFVLSAPMYSLRVGSFDVMLKLILQKINKKIDLVKK